MASEIKISLPLYKVFYAVFFVVVLSIIRGVTYINEIGIALEPPMAMLAAVFCADTYTQEITSNRSEIQRLYPMVKRVRSILERLAVQGIFLLLLAAVGYGLFFVFQSPRAFFYRAGGAKAEIQEFLLYLAAIIVTIGFFGTLSNTLAVFFSNVWIGIGISLGIWIVSNSSIGDKYFGSWNLFSYTFRDVESSSDFSWLHGKVVCICVAAVMLAVLPKILRGCRGSAGRKKEGQKDEY